MTIQEWNLVLNAVIAGLLIGGGIWLKHVVEQQLKTKDTAIQALENVVKMKEAQISSLRDEAAPALVQAYSEMRKHAELMTEDVNRLSTKLTHNENQQKALPGKLALAEVHGLMAASDLIEKHVMPFFNEPDEKHVVEIAKDPIKVFSDASYEVYSSINDEIQIRIDFAKKIVGEMKSLAQ